MTSKTRAASSPSPDDAADGPILLAYPCLRASGAQALDFLQRQTMNDLRPLVIGSAQRNGMLSAKGRVQTLFVVFRTAAEEFILAFPDGDAQRALTELRRFVLRSKVSLEPCADWQVLGATAATSTDVSPAVAMLPWDARRQLLLVAAEPQRSVDPRQVAEWYADDIDAGIAHLDQAGREDFTPQMLGLDRWRAYSLSKGCYPGQEIVARTHYLGQQKREMYRVSAERLAVGDVISTGERELARLFCCGLRAAGLAVLPLELPEMLTLGGDRECRVQPFARD